MMRSHILQDKNILKGELPSEASQVSVLHRFLGRDRIASSTSLCQLHSTNNYLPFSVILKTENSSWKWRFEIERE
jgi:hypothetical protein